MRAVDRVEAGIDRMERDESPHGQVRHGSVWVRLGIHWPFRRHRRALGPCGQGDDAGGGGCVSQAPESNHGLRPNTGQGISQGRSEWGDLDAIQLSLAIGQGPDRKLANGFVTCELAQRAV
jgi:hypothetical protein